jgi:hypothetical protein
MEASDIKDPPMNERKLRYIDGNHRMSAVNEINKIRRTARAAYTELYGELKNDDFDVEPMHDAAAPDDETEEQKNRRQARIKLGVLPIITTIPLIHLVNVDIDHGGVSARDLSSYLNYDAENVHSSIIDQLMLARLYVE